MSRTGDVVGKRGGLGNATSPPRMPHTKNWWVFGHPILRAGSTLADLERHADFPLLSVTRKPVGGYDEGEAAMGSALSQHQIGFQSGREYERAAIVKRLNDPRNSSRYLAETHRTWRASGATMSERRTREKLRRHRRVQRSGC